MPDRGSCAILLRQPRHHRVAHAAASAEQQLHALDVAVSQGENYRRHSEVVQLIWVGP